MTSTEKRIIDLLQAKQREDPDGFRDYLPTVSELLPSLGQEDGKTPLDLREEEMESHRIGFKQTLSKLESGAITAAEAIKGLEQCVFVMKYDYWKEDLWHDSVLGLVKAALGKSPESFLSVTTVRVGETVGPVKERYPLAMGVELHLDADSHPVAIEVHPEETRQFLASLKDDGPGRDIDPYASIKHDYYLGMIDPHGRD